MKSRKLHLKFILLNLLAGFMLILGFRQLAFLLNSRLVEGLIKYNSDLNKLGEYVLRGNTGSLSELITKYLFELFLAVLLATILSIITTWLMVSRERVNKINFIIILATILGIAFFIQKFDIDFHDLIPSLLGVISVVGVRTIFILNAALLLLLASQLYFNKKLKNHFYQQSA